MKPLAGLRVPRHDVRARRADPDEGERLREIAIAAKSHWGYDIDRVWQWAASGDYSPAGIRSKEIYVAEVDGGVVGWASIVAKDEVCWLDDLWIDPAWMRKGVGALLFRHAEERGKAAGATRMEWEAERNALGFYEKMGARYLRDSDPGVWGRVSAIMGVDLDPHA